MTAAGKTTVTRLATGTRFLITDDPTGAAASATPDSAGRWYVARNKKGMVVATFVRHNGSSGNRRSSYDLVVTLPSGETATVADQVGHQTVWLAPEPAPAVARKSIYTVRPTTRGDRDCVCPFPPGCSGSPCRSRGTRWEVRKLVRDRYDWATASTVTVVSEDRRSEQLSRIANELDAARTSIRETRAVDKEAASTDDSKTAPVSNAPTVPNRAHGAQADTTLSGTVPASVDGSTVVGYASSGQPTVVAYVKHGDVSDAPADQTDPAEPTGIDAEIAAKVAELDAVRKAFDANAERRNYGNMRTKSFGRRTDAALKVAGQLNAKAERLEREIAGLRRKAAAPAVPVLDLARLPFARFIRTNLGWFKVVRVNRVTVKVVAEPGWDDLIKISKILEIREPAPAAVAAPTPADPTHSPQKIRGTVEQGAATFRELLDEECDCADKDDRISLFDPETASYKRHDAMEPGDVIVWTGQPAVEVLRVHEPYTWTTGPLAGRKGFAHWGRRLDDGSEGWVPYGVDGRAPVRHTADHDATTDALFVSEW